ncbi:aldehyde dehydrogenase family protein [Pseudactinotalea sp.]|uniref:aldehyde dehydrogenase family protein n=1 Tax=Pseudactinotalea sp. TaxID=1926260 RepID=UPI003B3AA684
MKTLDKHYIGGRFVPATGPVGQVRDSATEEIVAHVHHATEAEIDAAVTAANEAAHGWAATPLTERIALVRRLADELDRHTDEFRAIAAQDVGTASKDWPWHSDGTTAVLRLAADAAETLELDTEIASARVQYQPVGTVASLTPWNVPLMMINCKVAPALLTGNTIVLKHSEVAPQAGALYAEVADVVGIPAGVLNVVTGGPNSGIALTEHPGIDMVAFTGSTQTGRHIMASAAGTLKKVLFELGGKNAHVVLDDADLKRAVTASVASTFQNNGQLCLATTRLLVPRRLQGRAVEIAVAAAESYVVGDPRDPQVTLGPVVSQGHRDRIRNMLNEGIQAGARVATGGPEAPEGLASGYFVRPTVLSDVPRESILAQEEIFGPVLTVMPYDGEDDAVALANNTVYGLWGAVWSADVERANAFARRMRAGGVQINEGAWDPRVPTGGVRQSGFSREGGVAGLHEYLLSQALFQPGQDSA